MGWTTDAEGHEGYAAYSVTLEPPGLRLLVEGSETADGLLVVADLSQGGRAETTGIVVVPWAQVNGWKAVCSCDWRSDNLARREDTSALLTGDTATPDNALLLDGRTAEEALRDEWLEHMQPDLERLRRVAAIRSAADTYWQARHDLDQAVSAAREEPALSWADIGQAAGMTRQSAHERWSRRPAR